jgi:hypothetical protein
MNRAPPEKRDGLRRTGILAGRDIRSFVSSQGQQERYSEAGDFTTPADLPDLTAEQRKALHSVAFWLRRTKLPFRRRWEAQPCENPRPLVCYGNFPGDPTWRHKVWIWTASGYLQDLGEPWMLNGADIAENVAKLIPGAAVLDCRHDYSVAA